MSLPIHPSFFSPSRKIYAIEKLTGETEHFSKRPVSNGWNKILGGKGIVSTPGFHKPPISDY